MDSHHTLKPQEVELELDRPEDVARIFRRMVQRNTIITVHAPGRAQVLLSAVLWMDPENQTIIIDSSGDAEANNSITRYPELRCIGQVDSVGVRFVLKGLSPVTHEGTPAFLAQVPASLLYLQRREHYRLRLPLSEPSWCHIPIEPVDGEIGSEQPFYQLQIIDISAGGLALRVPEECVVGFSAGTRFDGCRLVLPDIEPLSVSLRVKHLEEKRYDEGPGKWQAGVEFLKAGSAMQDRVQKTIMRIERELLARARGGG